MSYFKNDSLINHDGFFINPSMDSIGGIKRPIGDNNYRRLENICESDLLKHIQHSLINNNRCILKIITGEDHNCIKTNDNILKRIDAFADEHITENLLTSFPKHDNENDDDYKSRIRHIVMHQYFPRQLNAVRCDECIQKWLNSEEW